MTRRREDRSRIGVRLRAVGGMCAALLAMSAVSGCAGDVSPGVAATVNGTTISQDRVDSVTKALCAYTAANAAAGAQTGPPTALANLRAAIVQALIQFQLTDEAVSRLGLTVSQAAIGSAAASNTVPSGLDDSDADTLKDFFYQFAKLSTQVQLIGAHLADPSVTTYDQVKVDKSAEATKYLKSFAVKQDVTVNPAYGVWKGSTVVGGSGSLSIPVSDLATRSQAAASSLQSDTTHLPDSLVC